MPNPICPFAQLLPGADWGMNASRLLIPRVVTEHETVGRNSVGLGTGRHHSTPGTFNFLTGANGELWQFYPVNVRCSHAAGANYAGPGVENEHIPGEPRPAAQVAISNRLAEWLAAEWGIERTYVTGDPRVWVDQTPSTRGFYAHRKVDYPPNTSYRHFDEWAVEFGSTGPTMEDDPMKGMYIRKRGTTEVWLAHGGVRTYVTPALDGLFHAYGIGMALGMINLDVHDLDAATFDSFIPVTASGAPSGPAPAIDYAALAKAVNDDAARRLAS